MKKNKVLRNRLISEEKSMKIEWKSRFEEEFEDLVEKFSPKGVEATTDKEEKQN